MLKVFCLLLFFATTAFAQGNIDLSRPDNTNVLRQDGRLFTVQLVLGEPIRFFVVGREEAKLDMSDLKVTVRQLKPYPGKILSLDPKNDYFVATEPNDLKDATAIEVTATTKTKVDKVRFQIHNKKP